MEPAEKVLIGVLVAVPVVLLLFRRFRRRFWPVLLIIWLAALLIWLVMSDRGLIDCVRNGFQGC